MIYVQLLIILDAGNCKHSDLTKPTKISYFILIFIDGTMFHPFIDKSEVLYLFNPDTCR